MSDNIININERTIQAFIERKRPPAEIRDQLDLGYTYNDGDVELFERRPIWNQPNEYQNLPFAKIKFVKSTKTWKLYWKRASGKWQSYKPLPESGNLEKLITMIEGDAHGCFFG